VRSVRRHELAKSAKLTGKSGGYLNLIVSKYVGKDEPRAMQETFCLLFNIDLLQIRNSEADERTRSAIFQHDAKAVGIDHSLKL
jgi:hypothetical protein